MTGSNGAAIPLASVADRWLDRIARITDCAMPDGATLLGERAALNGFRVPGLVSAGGGCTLHQATDGLVALNLSRPSDIELLPALFGVDDAGPGDVARLVRERSAYALVSQGHLLGLAIAAADEGPASSPPIERRIATTAPPNRAPRILDLSALWAGPLAGHLLWLAGATVIKCESTRRPDAMRGGDTALFDLLNQGKASIALDFTARDGLQALRRLIAEADVVIEAARPRALAQLGLDADAIVAARPGLVWLTITGHGAQGDAVDWIGFGDDCAVAAGLTARLHRASGSAGFVGDAIADPLTGIRAALAIADALATGAGGRYILSMRAITTQAMDEAAATDEAALAASLRAWRAAEGQPFPAVARRASTPAPALGADNGRLSPC